MLMNREIPDEQYAADALWLDSYDSSKVPKDIQDKLQSDKHSPKAYGKRMREYLKLLTQKQQSHNPDYTKRYQKLSNAIDDLTPHQAYTVIARFLGNNTTQFFDQIPETANLQFPRDHMPKLTSQVGWHFFVGSVWAEDGQEYGLELMFFRQSILAPELAKKFGLSDIENQVVEIQLGISKAGDMHHQADPIVVAGTSGLIDVHTKPFKYVLGKNSIVGTGGKELTPLTIQARGVDRSTDKPFVLALDLNLTGGKDYLLQGDDGAMPSVAGTGSLYYSIPNIQVSAGSTLQYGKETVKLKNGLMWFDHQWGFLSGNPQSDVLRAANNISAPGPAGWDWYMAQFDGNRQITMFAAHSKKFLSYYFQTGDTPPSTMTVPVAGKYMDENGELHNTWGTLKITEWIQAKLSSNPELYPVTNVWHPNEWHFRFDHAMPEDIRCFSMHQIVPRGQTNFFANGAQYNEGAVYLKDSIGKDIGRGFAEAVQYADTTDNGMRLAGLDSSVELKRVLTNNKASLPRRIKSLVYMLTHQSNLKSVLKNAKGLEFFGNPTKTPKGRH